MDYLNSYYGASLSVFGHNANKQNLLLCTLQGFLRFKNKKKNCDKFLIFALKHKVWVYDKSPN